MSKTGKKNWIVCLVLLGIFAWSFWPTFTEIAARWSTPLYSHGYLVPVFSLFLLWHRRALIPEDLQARQWLSLPCIGVGVLLHLCGAYFYFDFASAMSIPIVLFGIALAVGGPGMLRWSWPAIAFLVFMLPLPFSIETTLSHPLQRVATLASTYSLQTLGFAAVAEGNIIIMEESRIGVVEACNGLGMLMTFFALAAAVTILMKGRIADKLIIFFSAVPIALSANVLRITLTGVLSEVMGKQISATTLHDLGGWVMMPLALGMLWIEQLLLAKLFTEQADDGESINFAQFTASTPAKCAV